LQFIEFQDKIKAFNTSSGAAKMVFLNWNKQIESRCDNEFAVGYRLINHSYIVKLKTMPVERRDNATWYPSEGREVVSASTRVVLPCNHARP